MAVKETMLGRTKKLLRVKFQIKTGTVTIDTTLGGSPVGFDEAFVKSEFRIRVNEWFDDLITSFAAVTWDESATIGDVIKDLLDRSTIDDITKVSVYRRHVTDLATTVFDGAAGAGAQSVPVASRPAVQEVLNESMQSSLLTDVSLGDLAGDRRTILSNVTDRMMI